jgi:hypothetical protein
MSEKVNRDSEWVGHRYGRWEILSTDYLWKGSKPYFLCQCHCPVCERDGEQPTIKYVLYYYMRKGLSNGCLRGAGHDKMTLNNPSRKKYNEYDLSGEYGVGVINTKRHREQFLFDLEDYDKIKNYTWHDSSRGYVRAIVRHGKREFEQIMLHRLVMGVHNEESAGLQVDHINHNMLDNRKRNLRICTPAENGINKEKTYVGFGAGICVQDGKYLVRFRRNGKKIYGGMFDTFEEAMKKRIELEPDTDFMFDPKSTMLAQREHKQLQKIILHKEAR